MRLVLGGRAILHARCHACGSNLLSEVLEFEQEVMREHQSDDSSDADEDSEPLGDPPTGEFDEALLSAVDS